MLMPVFAVHLSSSEQLAKAHGVSFLAKCGVWAKVFFFKTHLFAPTVCFPGKSFWCAQGIAGQMFFFVSRLHC